MGWSIWVSVSISILILKLDCDLQSEVKVKLSVSQVKCVREFQFFSVQGLSSLKITHPYKIGVNFIVL